MSKNVKRSMALVLSVALVVMFTIPANAVSIKEADVEKEFVCTVENEKITDENILLDRALKGMNDAPKEIVKSIEENVELSVNGVVQYEKPLITTELLKSYSNGKETQNVYATTIISKVKEDNNNLIPLSRTEIAKATAENGRTIDGTKTVCDGEVALYTIMYYATGVTEPFAYLKSVKAKISRMGNTYKAKSTQVRCGYKGIKYGGGKAVNYTSPWKSGTFDAQVSVTRVDLETSPAVIYHLWGESKAEVSRGTQSWTLTHKLTEGTDSLPSGGVH